MPKINRIRIINFAYNDDAREITDETFRFYDGENALLNLANGGGKSVLVQLMMQPILPDLKMQKRKMADYFKKGTSPTYVILEWKLDNPVRREYLMTGIAIAPRTSASDESGRIHYFTFGNYYRQASPFDLQSLPFVRQEKGRQFLMPFEKARESVKKIASSNREAFYFSREDAREYRKKLMEFGISQEEWKNIIVRMNNDEGGITELFERCSTSDSILNEWIIKNIEKVHLAGDTDQTGIQDLLKSLAEETMRKEDYIRAKERMEKYEGSHEKMEEALRQLEETLHQCRHAEGRFQGMYRALEQLQEQLEEQQEETARQMEQQEQKRRHILQEQASEQWYHSQAELKMICEKEEQTMMARKSVEESKKENAWLQECQRAARLWEKIEILQGVADALKRQIAKDQKENETSRRIRDLAYSLKQSWGKRLNEALEKEAAYKEQQDALQERRQQDKQEKSRLEENIRNLHQTKGMLEGKIRDFQKEEPEILEKTGVSLLRNLLGYLEPEEVRDAQNRLQTERNEAEKACGEAREEQDLLYRQEEEQAEGRMETDREFNALEYKHTEQEQWMAEFLKAEKECLAVLDLYDMEADLLYDKETAQKIIEDKIQEQRKRIAREQAEERQMEDLLDGMEHHNVYLPKSVLQRLEDADITYETGEDYLQNLEQERRMKVLDGNPLLAFGIIVPTEELKKINEVSYKGCMLRQLIPVFTYRELAESLPEGGPVYRYEKSPGFLAVCERELFDQEQRDCYIRRKKRQLEECRERSLHWEQEQDRLYQGKSILQSFGYEAGDRESMEKQMEDLKRQKAELEERRKVFQERQKDIRNRLEILRDRIPKLEKAWQEAAGRETRLEEFLKEDQNYQEMRRKLEEILQSLKKAQEQADRLQENQEAAEETASSLTQKLQGIRLQKDEAARQAAKYEFAQEGEFIEISLQQMEKEYDTLVREQTEGEASRKRQLEEKEHQIRETSAELEEIGLEPEDYQNLSYDPEELKQLKKDGNRLEMETSRLSREVEQIKEAKGKAESNASHAKKALEDTGLSEPLGKEEILQDYEHRIGCLEKEREECRKRQIQITRQKNDAENLMKRIGDFAEILPGEGEAVALEQDLNRQFRELRSQMQQARKQSQEKRQNCRKLYQEIRSEFYGKDKCISDILDTLEHLAFESEDLDQETLRPYIEEYQLKRESLKKLLDYYETQLENIYHTKQQVADQCMSYAVMLYEEIKFIVQKSRIRLTGKNRPVQMLRIDIPKQLDSGARERMEDYLDSCLEIIMKYNKEAEDREEKKVRERLAALTSGRELLNQVIGTSKIPVYVYKIDLNEKNSGMKRWEDAMSQNSGGEKFVVFFTMVSILITYIRAAGRRSAGEEPVEESKVLIMDNPFARTSSEHLLRAVMDIADTFSIQLICLSDLSQSSITNRFSLIYQLSIRKRMYSDKEVLKIGDMRVNQPGLSENEKLEHMEFYEAGSQAEIWDWMDQL